MKNNELQQSCKEIIDVGNNDSWFKGDPNRWPVATLPMAYASACVEVLTKKSEKGKVIYSQLVEAWGEANTQKMWEEIMAELSESDKERINQAFLHPEKELSPDVNKPYKDFEDMIKNIEINDEFIWHDDKTRKLFPADKRNEEKYTNFIRLILEFILVGFNRESDVENGRFRVAV